MEILRDGIWQFWGVVVGVLGVIVAIVIYMLQKNKKRLAFQVLADTPLLSVGDEIKEDIQIKYKNKKIQNIHLLVLKLENIGNVDISSSDFEEPIVILFPNSEILTAELSDASPKNLTPTVKIENSNITIEPILLNRKDQLTFKVIFSSYGNTIGIKSRILGVKQIERAFSELSAITTNEVMGGVVFLIGSSVLVYVALSTMFFLKNFTDPVLWVLLVVAGIFALFSLLFVYTLVEELTKGKNKNKP